MSQRLKVKYIFAGFEMGPIDPHDAVPVRALKTLLKANIPELRSGIQEAIQESFATCMNYTEHSSNGNVIKKSLTLNDDIQGGRL